MTEQECRIFETMVKLSLPPEERKWITERVSSLEERFTALDDIRTDGVLPLVTVSDLTNVLREDVTEKLLPREEILEGAPELYGDYFQVPRTVE